MPCSGCSALHGMNPNNKEKMFESWEKSLQNLFMQYIIPKTRGCSITKDTNSIALPWVSHEFQNSLFLSTLHNLYFIDLPINSYLNLENEE